MLLVEVGPEEGKQGVTPVEVAGRANGEVRQQGEPLGLAEDGAELAPVRVAEVESAESLETDHGGRMAAGGTGGKGDVRPSSYDLRAIVRPGAMPISWDPNTHNWY
jgi:hypothetical protein